MNTTLPDLTDLLAKTINAVVVSLSHNWIPLSLAIITAVILKVYVNTDRISEFLRSKTKISIFASVAVGAFTPFCACGTTAVVLGMLSTTLPWGPVMAFLTSSPLMSPDGFIMITGVISFRFAIALTAASLIIGLGTGFITKFIEDKTNFLKNQNRFAGTVPEVSCGCSGGKQTSCGCSQPAAETVCCPEPEIPKTCGCSGGVTNNEERGKENGAMRLIRRTKLDKFWDTFVTLGLKQILLFFVLFVAIGYLINYFVPTSIITMLFGAKNIFAVPLAALIGLPLYITTESGIPIIQSILKSGASEGAMLAFMITGSATSAWVIAGISSFLKKRAVGLYVFYILIGGIVLGYLYDFILMLLK